MSDGRTEEGKLGKRTVFEEKKDATKTRCARKRVSTGRTIRYWNGRTNRWIYPETELEEITELLLEGENPVGSHISPLEA